MWKQWDGWGSECGKHHGGGDFLGRALSTDCSWLQGFFITRLFRHTLSIAWISSAFLRWSFHFSMSLWQKATNCKTNLRYSACCLVRPWMEELIPEKNSLEKIPKPLKRWMGRPQLLPEIVENVLRSLWWGNGSKQPSPCLQPPKVGGLLRHLLLLLKAPLTSLHFWSQI